MHIPNKMTNFASSIRQKQFNVSPIYFFNMAEKMIYPNWDIETITGYQPKTNYWNEFVDAEKVGVSAIKETYDKLKDESKSSVINVAELYIVLNHKIWAYYDLHQATGDDRYYEISYLYHNLWISYEKFADELPMSEDDRRYFFEVTD